MRQQPIGTAPAVILVKALAVATLATVFVLAGPARAQDYGGGTLVVSDSTLRPGEPFEVRGTIACRPGAPVNVSFDGSLLGTTTADGQGFFTFQGTVPSNAQPGTSVIAAECEGGVQSVNVTILGSAAPLPRTGASDSTGDYVRAALTLLAGGLGAVVIARRRRASPVDTPVA